ncbi:MAG: hypothetical protein JWQ98_2355 [Chlorobi bacterium]|nr:hypothetical protein [Chlorobiota bacterium]
MTTRRIIIRAVFFSLAIACSAALYVYLQGQSSATETIPATASTDSLHRAAARDSARAAFVGLLQHTYSIDTLDADSSRLVADTAYRARPRDGHVGGRKVSISVCGVDSRLNERVEHADANHVITVWLDSGVVDIISIPRDTPCDAGFARNSNLNNLANVRARMGRDEYLREVTKIAGLDTIEYYIELGFSQARGLLELIGFRDNAEATLKVLRSRKAFASGDFQRCFNQGQFIRQAMLNHFGKLDGITGGFLVKAGLYLVTSNLTSDIVENIRQTLADHGFPKNRETVSVCIMPEYYAKMSVFNFGDSLVMGGLVNKINRQADHMGIDRRSGDSAMALFHSRIHGLIAKAIFDSAKAPVRVIANLRRCYEQRVWWQIADKSERSRVRAALAGLLAHAYLRVGKPAEAADVRNIAEFEEQMLVPQNGFGAN